MRNMQENKQELKNLQFFLQTFQNFLTLLCRNKKDNYIVTPNDFKNSIFPHSFQFGLSL